MPIFEKCNIKMAAILDLVAILNYENVGQIQLYGYNACPYVILCWADTRISS